ncbi:MAG: GNAT family N-acetyltransferase [Phycisphaerae bacterium]
MPSFTQATRSDLPTLLALQRDFYTHSHLDHTPAVAAATARLLDHDALGLAILIHTDTALAGYFVLTYGFSLERGGRFALLDELFILQTFRKQGLGKAAVSHAADLARHNHCRTLHLEADPRNTPALSLYHSLGFTTISRDYLTRPLDY